MGPVQNTKLWMMELTNLSKDALHVYVGLGIMLMAAVLLKRSLGDWLPIGIIAVFCIAGEALDVFEILVAGKEPRWGSNWKDIWNTMFWPATLFGLARFTGVLKR